MIDGLAAVVFDWAGTVVDHGCLAPVVALRQVFADHGVVLAEGDIRRDMGRAKRDHVAALLALPAVAAAWAAAQGTMPDAAAVDRVHHALAPAMRRAGADHADLISGAAAVVARLRRAGVRIGACTGYTRAMMAGIFGPAAAQGYAPDVTVCAGETPAGRPSPLMLWRVLVELGTWPADAAVKVDDAVVGIAEGQAAGCWTVGVAASGNGVGLPAAALAALPAAERAGRIAAARAALAEAGATEVVDTVAELWPALERIAARRRRGELPPRAPACPPG